MTIKLTQRIQQEHDARQVNMAFKHVHYMLSLYEVCRWTAAIAVQFIEDKTSCQDRKVLFSVGASEQQAEVLRSERRDQQAVNIVCLQQQSNQHVNKSLSSSTAPELCQVPSPVSSFRPTLVYTVDQTGRAFPSSLCPADMTLNQVCFKI